MTIKLTIKIDDDYADQKIKAVFDLKGETIEYYLEAFRSFLHCAGFPDEVTKKYMGEPYPLGGEK